jgi:hypothetical protein
MSMSSNSRLTTTILAYIIQPVTESAFTSFICLDSATRPVVLLMSREQGTNFKNRLWVSNSIYRSLQQLGMDCASQLLEMEPKDGLIELEELNQHFELITLLRRSSLAFDRLALDAAAVAGR